MRGVPARGLRHSSGDWHTWREQLSFSMQLMQALVRNTLADTSRRAALTRSRGLMPDEDQNIKGQISPLGRGSRDCGTLPAPQGTELGRGQCALQEEACRVASGRAVPIGRMRGMLPEDRMKLGTLDRLGRDPGAARRFFLRSFTGADVLTGFLTVILVLVALTSSESLADRLAWAAVVFAGATLLLAGIVSAIVAGIESRSFPR
jgi:hypothetical protein